MGTDFPHPLSPRTRGGVCPRWGEGQRREVAREKGRSAGPYCLMPP